MKKLKKLLGLLGLFLLLYPMCLSLAAAEELDTPVHEDPPIDLQYIRQAECSLDIPGTSASIYCYVKGTYGSTTKCKIELSLQKKTLLWWTTVETWEKTEMNWQTSLSAVKAVNSGTTYRVKAVFTVWNGSDYEATTVVTQSKKAP